MVLYHNFKRNYLKAINQTVFIMKKKLSLFIFTMSFMFVHSQNNIFWQKQAPANILDVKESRQNLPKMQTYSLDFQSLKEYLKDAPERGSFSGNSNLILSFPNADGEFEQFRIMEASVMHPDLSARYPDIKSYAGQGIEDPTARIRFSMSPLGLQSMRLSSSKNASFIEPYTNDLRQYTVYKRQDRTSDLDSFECEVTNSTSRAISGDGTLRNADDSILRTYRLAVSATGEYTQYHGGTKALALAAMNTTMTRVNGIYESDFNVTLVLIANTDDVIYTSTSSDPYGNSTSGYNNALQSTLTSVIGEANYDIGHLFANLQNNGNAGCIGCVCVNGQKGSGWTSHVAPEGDPFDVDYVAHEMGHQFGGNHTWTHGGNEGSGVQMEPGSGSTIMGYAGITGSTDVQSNSDPYFHAASIEQITDYIKSRSCQTNTNISNAVPTADAGSNYTIPKGTPFVLTGAGTDADAGDVLTYCWEQMNNGSTSTTNPNPNATSGPAFRSFNPTTDTNRYFPRLETIKTGATSWQWEAVPNVARTMNFRMTVRDNQAGGGTNNSDDSVITVNGTAGPFVLNAPNTNVTWNAGTTQTVTWNVAGTTGNGVNASNVDIFLSIDGGDTYPISLAAGVPNDGSHDIVVPNNQGSQNRIMIKGSNHVFFDISNTDFTITGQVVCNATVPAGVAASSIGPDSATLSWDAVPGASFDLQYRVVGSGTWATLSVNGISSVLSGLTAITQYEAQVRSTCPDNSTSAYSGIINFTTTDVLLNYCNSASTNVNDEFISRVQLNTIDNSSGAQFYSDFTSISTTLTKDSQYTITVTPTWTGTVYNEAYAVWIDYNRDGDFADTGEQVWTQGNTQTSSVSGNFTVPVGAVENSTRMRVSMKYNGIPTSCESFTYGEVEDYTIIIEGSGPDTTSPVITLNGPSTIDLNVGDTYTEQGATATDNIDGDLTSSIVVGGDIVDTNAGGVYVVTYNVSDAAGNAATEITRTVNVIPDTTAPIITRIGAATINLELGASYTDQGATATDNIDGDLTSSIVVGGDVFDTNIVGAYVITYNVSDAAGNAATEATRTVNVNPDTTAPIITLIGASTLNLNVGETYNEQGATASDNLDGDLTSSIVISGIVDTNLAGTYFVNYNVSDSFGNAANQITRTVNVNADLTPPVITLIGASTINLIVGDIYNEQGATATDNIDGNLTSSIVIAGTVNTAVTGIYMVTYNVSDAAGNDATEVIRTMNVSEPSIGCASGISTFPYTEGFENTLGAWTQSTVDDINWTVDANGTPSNNTGPASASQGTYYVFVEASSPNFPSKRAILNSPCFDLSALSEATFSFKYHQFGSTDMGTIDLELSDDEGATWTSIWNSSGNQGNSWLTANVDLTAYVGGGVQLRFNRFVGGTWQADIAIDDVSLIDGAVVVTGCSGGITSFPYTEGFENTLGAWSQSSADDINWTVDANGTPSNGTGPSSAIQGSYYIFVEASGNGTGYPNKRAIINSPCYDLNAQSSASFSFNYHQYGSTDMGTLALEVSNDNGSSWVSMWNSSGNLGNSWQSANVDLTAYVGGSIQLRFNRVTGSTWQADIAVDNINLTTASSAKDDSIVSRVDDQIGIDIKLYPNPVKGSYLNIKSMFSEVKYEVFSTIGQLVAKGSVINNKIDISELDSAVYHITFFAEGEIINKRFIRE